MATEVENTVFDSFDRARPGVRAADMAYRFAFDTSLLIRVSKHGCVSCRLVMDRVGGGWAVGVVFAEGDILEAERTGLGRDNVDVDGFPRAVQPVESDERDVAEAVDELRIVVGEIRELSEDGEVGRGDTGGRRVDRLPPVVELLELGVGARVA